MSLQSWLQNSWLVQHKTSSEEIANLFRISDRNLAACKAKELRARLETCHRLQRCTASSLGGSAAAGYRASRDNHHYRVIQSLEFTIESGRKQIDTFDGFRKKRNVSSYDVSGMVSEKEADEMFKLAAEIRSAVREMDPDDAPRTWLGESPQLKWAGNQEAVTFLGYRPIRS